jgi:excisionase family DNA binding protein
VIIGRFFAILQTRRIETCLICAIGGIMKMNTGIKGFEPELMSVHEVADYLRLSEAKVYRMANSGCIPALRMGKTWRFKKEILDEWIRRETRGGGPFFEQTEIIKAPV